MKKLFSLIAVLMMNVYVFGQPGFKPNHNRGNLEARKNLVETTDVPQVVKDAQQKQFPNTSVEKWFIKNPQVEQKGSENKKAKSVYVALFKNTEGYMTHCRITDTGELRGSMTRLQGEKGLPQNIKDAVSKRFSGFKIVESQKIWNTKQNKNFYRIVLVQNSTRVITFTDENGNELKEANLPEDTKENMMDVPTENKGK